MTHGECKYPTCHRVGRRVLGFCVAHYERMRRGRDMAPPLRLRAANGQRARCKVPACERTSKAHGYCATHYNRAQQGTDLNAPIRTQRIGVFFCEEEGCDRPYHANGMCAPHYARAWRRLHPEKQAIHLARQRRRYATDHVFRERHKAYNRERVRERYRSDPEYREARKAYNQKRRATGKP